MGAREMAADDEAAMVEALQQGDERAFEWLVQQLHVLKGLPRFQLRSSLKTWMTQILVNRARTRARRDVLQRQVAADGAARRRPLPAKWGIRARDRQLKRWQVR